MKTASLTPSFHLSRDGMPSPWNETGMELPAQLPLADQASGPAADDEEMEECFVLGYN